MVGEWRAVTVAEIAAPVRNALVGGPFGSNLVSSDYSDSGVPVIRGQNMSGRWIAGEFAFVSSEKADSLSANIARPQDVIFTQRGTLGQVGVVPVGEYDRYIISQSQMKLTVNPALADPMFIYYLFSTHAQQEYIRQNSIQTGVPHTNLGVLRSTPIRLPPLGEQRAIAQVLAALDDKIELNRRMNETLEAIARALFKSWFVDFDPVRVRAESRDTRLPKEVTNLFPNGFEDSELGAIPEGWNVGVLEDVLVLQRGFDLPAAQRASGSYPVLAASGPSGTHDKFKVRGPGVTTGRSGLLGQAFYVARDFWPLNTSLWVKEFRRSRPAYAFHLLRGLDFAMFNAGSAVPTLNRNHVHMLPTLLPPMDLVDKFEHLATASLRCQTYNDEMSTTATALRDALLPRLISGELRVPESKLTSS
jgi:type I restriction enzyme S subunit